MRARVARTQSLLELALKALGLGNGEMQGGAIHPTNMASGCSLPDYVIVKSISRCLACLRCYRHRGSCKSRGAPTPGASFLTLDHSVSN